MQQYLDEKDGKWHVTMTVKVPSMTIKNVLNFRLHSVIMKDCSTVKDPELKSSSYVFNIPVKFLNKNIFFNAYFDPNEIKGIDLFKFGLCDEKVKWHESTFFTVVNKLHSYPEAKEESFEKIVEVESDNSDDFVLQKISVELETTPIINEDIIEEHKITEIETHILHSDDIEAKEPNLKESDLNELNLANSRNSGTITQSAPKSFNKKLKKTKL